MSIQVGAPIYSPNKRTTRAVSAAHTPKKVKKDVPKTSRVTPLNVNGIPGPSGSKKKPMVSKQKTSGKCHVCHIIWESRSDMEFRKRNGHRKTTWIGCDKKGCKFWTRANCAGLFLIPGKKVENHMYYCKHHKSSK